MSSVFLKKVFVEFSRPFQKCARARIQAACTRKKRAAEAAHRLRRGGASWYHERTKESMKGGALYAYRDRSGCERKNIHAPARDRGKGRGEPWTADFTRPRAEFSSDGTAARGGNAQPRRAHGGGADVFAPCGPRVRGSRRPSTADAHAGRSASDPAGGGAPRAGRTDRVERTCRQARAAERDARAHRRVQKLHDRAGNAVPCVRGERAR